MREAKRGEGDLVGVDLTALCELYGEVVEAIHSCCVAFLLCCDFMVLAIGGLALDCVSSARERGIFCAWRLRLYSKAETELLRCCS